MIRNYIIIACAAMALSSCTTVKNTASTEAVDTKIASMTVADLQVDKEKVSKTVKWNWSPLTSVSVADKKENATGELLLEKDADVLIEPQYVVNHRGLFRGGSVTVTGYPAKYYNFRPMTKEDAEMIATANGDYVPGVPMVVESTAKFSPFAKKRKKRKASLFDGDNGFSSTSFIALTGGPTKETNDYFEVGFNLGLMYGHYGTKWGFYAKASIINADYKYADLEYGTGSKNKTTGTFTIGAIKTLGKHNNLFVGVGVGGYFAEKYVEIDNGRYPEWKWKAICKFALPVDLGWQWHSGNINAMLGITANMPVTGGSDVKNYLLNPFVGIGYNF